MLLVKNPAGANEVLRTLETGVPPVLVIALNDAIADGQDVSWIWDVDFEPLLPHVERVIASGDRAAELGLRFVYGGLPEERLEVVPSLERALDRGLELIEAGRRPRRPPDLHGDARAPRDPHAIAGSCDRTGRRAAVRIRVGHLYPDYLNIYADRGNIAVLARRAALRGHELDVDAVGLGDPLAPGAHDLLYVGGGQDREQALIAPDLAAKRRRDRGGGRRRRGTARRLRRVPAPRPRLPRARRLVHARAPGSSRTRRSPVRRG